MGTKQVGPVLTFMADISEPARIFVCLVLPMLNIPVEIKLCCSSGPEVCKCWYFVTHLTKQTTRICFKCWPSVTRNNDLSLTTTTFELNSFARILKKTPNTFANC